MASAIAHNLYLASQEPEAAPKPKPTKKSAKASESVADTTAPKEQTEEPTSGKKAPAMKPVTLKDKETKAFLDSFREFLREIDKADGFSISEEPSVKKAKELLGEISGVAGEISSNPVLRKLSGSQPLPEIVFLPYVVFRSMTPTEDGELIDELVHTWLLYRVFEEAMSTDVRERLAYGGWRGILDILLREDTKPTVGVLRTAEEQAYAGVHDYEGTTWFDRDRFYGLLFWRWVDTKCRGTKEMSVPEIEKTVSAAEASGYKLADFEKRLAKGRRKR